MSKIKLHKYNNGDRIQVGHAVKDPIDGRYYLELDNHHDLTSIAIGICCCAIGTLLTIFHSLWWIILIILGIVGITEGMKNE